DERISAGRDDDVTGRVSPAIDFDRAGPGQSAGATQQGDTAVGQPALLACVGVVRDHEVPPGQCGLDVDLCTRTRVPRVLHRLARAKQRLRRNAGPVRALAADELSLDDCDAQPACSERRRAVLAGCAATEHDDVVLAHLGSSVPDFSATMYAAYHSGQFSSLCPVRFSCSPWAASARRMAFARSVADANDVAVASTRPGSRVVISCTSHSLPSGSLNVARER